ncbi:aldo/keto reductase [Streptomyces wuyuanensis]|uniref:aldo/keto reductase n=1 Tax=Streptomyces wuyuanensis TaxID=1196353 RepID=UPI0037B4D653
MSETGYGAWGIGESGWVGATEEESVCALRGAVDLGVNLVGTARGYGESERIVGGVVRSRAGGDVLVATKVPRRTAHGPPPTDWIRPRRSRASTSARVRRPVCAPAASTTTTY